MSKQTAAEWLVSELNQKIDFIPMDKWDMIRDIVEQAKEMEKQRAQEYAEFAIMCDRKKMFILNFEDWIRFYNVEFH